MSPNLRFLVKTAVFVRCRVGERVILACVVPTVKQGGGGVMVWVYFVVTVSDLFRIQGTPPHQHSAAIRHPIWFMLSGTIICFSTAH
jgi:hypothetical protein